MHVRSNQPMLKRRFGPLFTLILIAILVQLVQIVLIVQALALGGRSLVNGSERVPSLRLFARLPLVLILVAFALLILLIAISVLVVCH